MPHPDFDRLERLERSAGTGTIGTSFDYVSAAVERLEPMLFPGIAIDDLSATR
jgi:hypothetical protein